jgi:4'-phosphopantetheinyl transferase
MSGPKHILDLGRNCIHVWRISTLVDDGCFGALASVLSPEEIVQADRFHFERDRRSFVVCRGTLRRLLAFYAGGSAAEIRFRHGSMGKPYLASSPELQFNVSHSNGIALLAFAVEQEIGVDVEFMRPEIDFAGLAEHSFSEAERAEVLACSSQDRANIFYQYWTCKEACIKADGRGMSIPLEQFSVIALEHDAQRRGIVSHCSIGLAPGMRVCLLDADDHYAAAVASSAPNWGVLRLDLDLCRDDDQGAIRRHHCDDKSHEHSLPGFLSGARSEGQEVSLSSASLGVDRAWGKR